MHGVVDPNAFKELTLTAKKPQMVSDAMCSAELTG
jgi:hypothetical protein